MNSMAGEFGGKREGDGDRLGEVGDRVLAEWGMDDERRPGEGIGSRSGDGDESYTGGGTKDVFLEL